MTIISRHASSSQKNLQNSVTETTPFACPYCDQGRFSEDDDLWQHVKDEHGQRITDLGVSSPDSSELYRKLLRGEAIHKAKSGSSSTRSRALSTVELRRANKQPGQLTRNNLSAITDVARGNTYTLPNRRARQARKKREPTPNLEPYEAHVENQNHRPCSSGSAKAGVRSPLSAKESSSGTTPVLSPPFNGDSVLLSHDTEVGPRGALEVAVDDRNPELLLRQPDSRPISQSQLAAEVKSIYAGLVMVENKCISVDKAQAAAVKEVDRSQLPPLADDHWQALIALHRTLLHEHHDFFLASQHPSATPALQRLALKYSMPARMWKHGIHSFLELLRRRLPESLDFMLSFIYLAYQMVALLFETVPAFEQTWIECLDDVGRYRMAIEDEDMRDRETWASVAHFWYGKAAVKNPTVGRLYHHLAILARPDALQQLFYYTRSLACIQPFISTRESILTLLDPVLGYTRTRYSSACEFDTAFIKLHGLLFKREELQTFHRMTDDYLCQLDGHIGRVNAEWRDQGVFIAVTNISSLFDYGHEDSVLKKLFNLRWKKEIKTITRPRGAGGSENESDIPPPKEDSAEASIQQFNLLDQPTFDSALRITFGTFTLALQRIGDENTLTHIHCLLVFLLHLSRIPYGCSTILEQVPWDILKDFLNALANAGANAESVISCPEGDFPPQLEGSMGLLPEDWLIQGQIWNLDYFPSTWFESEIDEEERFKEVDSTKHSRIERLLWLGVHLAQETEWLDFDRGQKIWAVNPEAIKANSDPVPERMGSDISAEGSCFRSETDIIMSEKTITTTSLTDYSDSMDEAIESNAYSSRLTPHTKRNIFPNYTIIVGDTQMLLSQPEIFTMLLDSSNWKVLIPRVVISELHSHVTKDRNRTIQAKQALISISSAFSQSKSLAIVDENGNAVPDAAELLSAERSPVSDFESWDQIEDVIISIARLLVERTLQKLGDGQSIPGAKPVVLVAENRKIRFKARQQGLTSVASLMVRRFLCSQGRTPEGASERLMIESLSIV